jgi:hypothetical protein
MAHERYRIRAQELYRGQSEAPGPSQADHQLETVEYSRLRLPFAFELIRIDSAAVADL